MNATEITSLINLLDDPDELIFQHVEEKLIQIGSEVIPFLEKSWEENKYNSLFLERIESLIDTIQFNQIIHELKNWNSTENHVLLNGWILLTKWQFPGINELKLKENSRHKKKY